MATLARFWWMRHCRKEAAWMNPMADFLREVLAIFRCDKARCAVQHGYVIQAHSTLEGGF
jgi:hypothetical protein